MVDLLLVVSGDLLYIMYILGIIGKFKGIVCDNGGYVIVVCYVVCIIYGM